MPLSGPVCILSCQEKKQYHLASPDIIITTIDCPVLTHTHTVITFSDMQHSDNCKDGGRLRGSECGTEPRRKRPLWCEEGRISVALSPVWIQ